MTVINLIEKQLKFKEFRRIDLTFRLHGRLDVLVKPFKSCCRCPRCGRRGKIIWTRSELQF